MIRSSENGVCVWSGWWEVWDCCEDNNQHTRLGKLQDGWKRMWTSWKISRVLKGRSISGLDNNHDIKLATFRECQSDNYLLKSWGIGAFKTGVGQKFSVEERIPCSECKDILSQDLEDLENFHFHFTNSTRSIEAIFFSSHTWLHTQYYGNFRLWETQSWEWCVCHEIVMLPALL